MANSSFNLSDLNGKNGFVINGIAANEGLGYRVSNAGDINNDGFDDLIIRGNSKNYVVFGKTNLASVGTFNLLSLNGTNGFTVNNSGSPVSNGGRVVSYNQRKMTIVLEGDRKLTNGLYE